MSKKTIKIRNRKSRLLFLIDHNESPYCTKHKSYLDKQTIINKNCYIGNHGRSYCKYLRLR